MSKLRHCECMKVIKESKCYMEVLIIPETVITALQIHGLKSIDLLSLKIKLQYSNILIPNWLKCLLKINFSSFWEAYLWIFSISFCRYSNNSNNLSLIFYTSKCVFTRQIPPFPPQVLLGNSKGQFGKLCWPRKRDLLSPLFSLLFSESSSGPTCLLGMGSWFNFVALFCFSFNEYTFWR